MEIQLQDIFLPLPPNFVAESILPNRSNGMFNCLLYSSPAVEFLEDNPKEELGLTTALPIEDQMDTGTQGQSYRPLGAKTESHL